MVVADQMQEAMDQQSLQFLLQRKACVNCLFSCNGRRYDDIPEHVRLDPVKTPFPQRKRKNIGGFVLAPILPVERPHGAVADKKHAQFGIRKVEFLQQLRELRF